MITRNVLRNAQRSFGGCWGLQPYADQVARLLRAAGLQCDCVPNIRDVTHGKLLINLFNAVNALSGGSIFELLLARDYREVVSLSISEALQVYKGEMHCAFEFDARFSIGKGWSILLRMHDFSTAHVLPNVVVWNLLHIGPMKICFKPCTLSGLSTTVFKIEKMFSHTTRMSVRCTVTIHHQCS